MDHKAAFIYHDLLKEPPDLKELKKLADIGSLSVRDLVNLKSQVFKKMDVDLDSMDEKSIADLISENPRIMIRPLLNNGKKLWMGFKESAYQDILKL
ncbi:MAG TPA: ArsC/Spx/MgsR family protein [Syntrophomonadaceae bacterium]|mgnify:CR=1 FL=1|nr:ArsC/Spx/MgsR family protein [Syntrophomonadaceae bacterium]HRX22145.1 ArsC/Spx/MgsR family protein [Syntrophomonadaceae bacterium]